MIALHKCFSMAFCMFLRLITFERGRIGNRDCLRTLFWLNYSSTALKYNWGLLAFWTPTWRLPQEVMAYVHVILGIRSFRAWNKLNYSKSMKIHVSPLLAHFWEQVQLDSCQRWNRVQPKQSRRWKAKVDPPHPCEVSTEDNSQHWNKWTSTEINRQYWRFTHISWNLRT